MSIPTPVNTYGIAVGSAPTTPAFVTNYNPSSTNLLGPSGPFKIGQRWVNDILNETFTLTSFTSLGGIVSAVWTQEGGSGAGTVTSVTGTANQVAASPTTGAVVVSLPSTVVAPGSVTATTFLATTNGNLTLGTIGNKLIIKPGSNASIGTSANMVSGTVTVSTTAVDASSIIFAVHNTIGGTPGVLSVPVGSIVAGTSFVINSSATTDTSTCNWWVIS